MKEFVSGFRNVILSSEEKFLTISDEQSSRKPSPGKWSSKQILGHLVDSSINNMTRFINGQFQDELVFSGYNQDKWVEAQNYDAAEWHFVISLWKNNNLQIARLVESIPRNILIQPHKNHNFDAIAFNELSKDQPATLEYLIRDYVVHMKHHLNQIFKMNAMDVIY